MEPKITTFYGDAVTMSKPQSFDNDGDYEYVDKIEDEDLEMDDYDDR